MKQLIILVLLAFNIHADINVTYEEAWSEFKESNATDCQVQR